MMRRMGLFGSAVAILGYCSLALAADDLQAVQKKICEAWGKHKSMSAKVDYSNHMEMAGTVMDQKGTGTHEFLRKGDKAMTRTELKTQMVTKTGDQENKMETQVTMIVDGDFAYTLSEVAGQKSATKSKIAQSMSADPKDNFEWYAKQYQLKLLPDETIDGKKAYAIEATAKDKAAAQEFKSVMYYLQDSGFLVKQVGFDTAGKPNSTVTFSDIKLDPDLNPDRFVFKAPPDVTVIDQTNVGTPAGEPGKTEGGTHP
jgi:outer membrane lipoprotein-sorting protein